MNQEEINKWIEDEAQKYQQSLPEGMFMLGRAGVYKEGHIAGATAIYQFILPQLEECKEQLAQAKKERVELEKKIDYWKQRCEAAEGVNNVLMLRGTISKKKEAAAMLEISQAYKIWQTLKQQST